jgi:hypothetical protein
VVGGDAAEHEEPVIESCSLERFVGKGAGEQPDYVIGPGERGAGDREVGDGGRIPGAGKEGDAIWRATGCTMLKRKSHLNRCITRGQS